MKVNTDREMDIKITGEYIVASIDELIDKLQAEKDKGFDIIAFCGEIKSMDGEVVYVYYDECEDAVEPEDERVIDMMDDECPF
jgi:hypothetical protein